MVKNARTSFRDMGERLVIVAIVLVLAHILLQDLGDLFQWRWSVRKSLIYAGVAFDIFFSAEFVSRLLLSIIRRKPHIYLRDNRGWIDFVASIPLLIFSSGPAALSAYNDVPTIATAAGVFGVLRIVKAIRVARVLRLLRLLKIFKHIKHVNSTMAQRHVARISTIMVSTVVVTLIAFSFVSSGLRFPDLESSFEAYTLAALDARISADMSADDISAITDLRPDVLIIKSSGSTIYSRAPDSHYQAYYGPSDYTIASFPAYDIQVYIDLLPIVSHAARQDILHLAIIVMLILGMLFLYGSHFAVTVSDPVQIMSRGLRKRGHSLRVVLSDRYKHDEIYELANSYNEVFLPLKDRIEGSGSAEGAVSDIRIEDVKRFIDT